MKGPSVLVYSSAFLVSFAHALSSVIPLRMANVGFSPFYDAEIKLGNQTFFLLADTGSSDTWVVRTGYQCINGTSNGKLPQDACTYAPATYDPSPSFQQITNETFGATYGHGIAVGIIGTEDVTLGGITVHGQPIGVVDSVTLPGDNINSGILGLGHTPLTSAHPGTEQQSNDSLLLNKAPYDPLFVRMYEQGSTEPWFSLALDRLPQTATTGPGGYLGLGALPPVNYSSVFAIAPVEVTDVIPLQLTGGVPIITEWTLSVQGVTWGAQNAPTTTTNTTSFQAVVDSGNYFNEFPQQIADGIHAAYDPPAVFDEGTQMYIVDCNAKPPTLGITISGQTFFHLPEDLILKTSSGPCVSTILGPAVGQGGLSLNFLGDVFMQNVVSVFDFGKNEMRFAARSDGGGVVVGNASATAPSPTSVPTATSGGSIVSPTGSLGGMLILLVSLIFMS